MGFHQGCDLSKPCNNVSTDTEFDTVAWDSPSSAETDMCDSNTAEDKQYSDARQRQQPGEDISAAGSEIDVCQKSEQKLNNHHNDWTTLLINVGSDFRTHTWRNIMISKELIFYGAGHSPFAARACIVRVEPKVQALATLMTAIRMTALKIDGRTLIPASWIAITKGEWSELAPALPFSASLSTGTTRPTRARFTT